MSEIKPLTIEQMRQIIANFPYHYWDFAKRFHVDDDGTCLIQALAAWVEAEAEQRYARNLRGNWRDGRTVDYYRAEVRKAIGWPEGK